MMDKNGLPKQALQYKEKCTKLDTAIGNNQTTKSSTTI